MLSFISFVLAVGIAWLFLPLFNDLAVKNLSLPFDELSFYATLIVAALIVGFLSGLYPSFFLSSFKPVNVLKGRLALGTKNRLYAAASLCFNS